MKTSVTIHDVAVAAGVSVSTVSRVLNNKSDVASETARRVRLVIDELGYGSSLAARSMRSRKTNVIGLIAPDLEQSFPLQVVKGVSQAIKHCGYDLIAYTGGKRREQTRASWEQQQVALLNGTITDGIIVVTPYAQTLRSSYPLVAVDPHSGSTDFPSVISTNREGVMEAMSYLFDLGHWRIGFISGRSDLQSAQQRLRGYEESLAQAGIPVDSDLIKIGEYSRETGFACAQQLLQLASPVTAILAANDEMAFGVYDAAAEAGIRIPEDLSVVGFDNIAEAAGASPPLTTVDQSIAEMGQLAATLLIRLIAGEQLADKLYKVATRLVVRQSCRSLLDSRPVA